MELTKFNENNIQKLPIALEQFSMIEFNFLVL